MSPEGTPPYLQVVLSGGVDSHADNEYLARTSTDHTPLIVRRVWCALCQVVTRDTMVTKVAITLRVVQ